jgi:hypothetical protein
MQRYLEAKLILQLHRSRLYNYSTTVCYILRHFVYIHCYSFALFLCRIFCHRPFYPKRCYISELPANCYISFDLDESRRPTSVNDFFRCSLFSTRRVHIRMCTSTSLIISFWYILPPIIPFLYSTVIIIKGIRKIISVSKIKKMILIRKNWILNGRCVWESGSNPHSKDDIFS